MSAEVMVATVQVPVGHQQDLIKIQAAVEHVMEV